MANKSVLKEFLVSLGFKVDPSGIREFVGATGRATKVALETGAAVTGAAAAVEAYVQVFASSMEKLYYSSKRTGAAVENIEALEFAAKQVGVSADDARGALESMAATLRLNPQMRAMLNNIVGHETAGQDAARSMLEMVQSLNQRFPHHIGARMAAMFGMDEKTFYMLSQQGPKIQAAQDKYHQMQKRAGVDTDKAAEASVEYMNALRGVWTQVTILYQALAIALLPTMQKFVGILGGIIERFSIWVGKNKELLQTRLEDFLRGLVGWLGKIDFDKAFKWLDDGVKKIDKFVQALGGWETAGYAVVAVMAGPLLLAFSNLGIAIAALMAKPHVIAFAAMLGAGVLFIKALQAAGEEKAVQAPGLPSGGLPPGVSRPPGNLGPMQEILRNGVRPNLRAIEEAMQKEIDRQNAHGRLQGWEPSSTGPDGDVVRTPSSSNRHLSTEQRMAVLVNELFNGATEGRSDSSTAELFKDISKMYKAVRPHGGAVQFEGATVTGHPGGTVTIQQTTEINVSGSGNPTEAANQVLKGQSSVNESLVRDFSSKAFA